MCVGLWEQQHLLLGLKKVIKKDVCDNVVGSHRRELEKKDCLFLVYRILLSALTTFTSEPQGRMVTFSVTIRLLF